MNYSNGNVIPTFRILINGKPIKQYFDSQGQTWIEAKEGSKYSIEVNNPTFNRVLAIISVDGINVITGEPAEMDAKDGYIINAHSKIVIDGWRISDDKVKEFLFTFNKEKSYSVKLGNGKANLGIIGLALYSEKVNYTWNNTTWYNSSNISNADYSYTSGSTYTTSLGNNGDNISPTSCCANFSAGINDFGNPVGTRSLKRDSFQAGTAKGKEVDSKVIEVEFESSGLIATSLIYYDSYANLKKNGIIYEQKMPQAFKPTKYCRDI